MSEEREVLGGLEKVVQHETTRRGFLKLGASAGVSLAMAGAFTNVVIAANFSSNSGLLILTNAKGMVLADPTRCTGCRRCELACTEYNDGKSQPSVSRIQVGRNVNFGPSGPQGGFNRGEGTYGNLRIIQDTCKQCPHPVPCATACPQGAIAADPVTGARVVDAEKCIGCGLCGGACPWQMIQVDPDTKKATKCYLCGECVAACPNGAIRFVPWRDTTKDSPARVSAFKISAEDARSSCAPCHVKQ
ncbi:MAG TPA: 4Fe-4S binding protein [Chloroflexota bacterium]|nr:4Fe-4S binding protein [Chloroflexota bacterium]